MINLLPRDIVDERMYGRRNKVLIGYVVAFSLTAVLVAIVMLGSLEFFGTDETSIKREIGQNEATISNLKSNTSELNQTVNRLETVNTLYESNVIFSELIPNIGSILPEGAVLNGLSLTGGSTDALTLDVDLEEPEIAATLVRNLVESEIFEAADVGNLNPKGADGDRYRYGTSVSVNFEGAAAAKAAAERAAKEKAAAKAAEESGSN